MSSFNCLSLCLIMTLKSYYIENITFYYSGILWQFVTKMAVSHGSNLGSDSFKHSYAQEYKQLIYSEDL